VAEAVPGNVEDECGRCRHYRAPEDEFTKDPSNATFSTLFQCLDRHEGHVAPDFFGQLREIRFVERRKDERLDAEPPRRERFFPDAAHRQAPTR
jgi:hypothetical protein